MRLTAILLIALLATVARGAASAPAVVWVRVYDVVVRSSPSFVSPAVGRAYYTQPLQVLGSSNAWCRITTGEHPPRFTYDARRGWVHATNAVTLDGWIHRSAVTTNALAPASMTELARPTALGSGHGGSNEAMRMMKDLEDGQ